MAGDICSQLTLPKWWTGRTSFPEGFVGVVAVPGSGELFESSFGRGGNS
jgi:hypothetical protein